MSRALENAGLTPRTPHTSCLEPVDCLLGVTEKNGTMVQATLIGIRHIEITKISRSRNTMKLQ